MLMYGSCVAVLAYKAGKCERDKLIKAKNKKGNSLYFYRSSIDYLLLDNNVPDMVLVRIAGERLICPIEGNPWASNLISGVSE